MIAGSVITHTNASSAIPVWFDKKITLAAGLTYSGSSVGALLGPFFIIYFADLYGVRGSFMIIAGLFMQVIVIGALQRPSPKAKKHDKHPVEKKFKHADDNAEIIWQSDKYGKSTITVTVDKNVKVDVKPQHHKINGNEEGQSVKPSYFALLKRPKVLRALTIVFLGITGGVGKCCCIQYSNYL